MPFYLVALLVVMRHQAKVSNLSARVQAIQHWLHLVLEVLDHAVLVQLRKTALELVHALKEKQ